MKEWLCCLACFFPSQKEISKDFLTELADISAKRNEMCLHLNNISLLQQISYAENNSHRWTILQSEAKEKIKQLEKKALNRQDCQYFLELKMKIEQQEVTWQQIIVEK